MVVEHSKATKRPCIYTYKGSNKSPCNYYSATGTPFGSKDSFSGDQQYLQSTNSTQIVTQTMDGFRLLVAITIDRVLIGFYGELGMVFYAIEAILDQ